MKHITITLTEDQIIHLQQVLSEKIKTDRSRFSTRLLIRLAEAEKAHYAKN